MPTAAGVRENRRDEGRERERDRGGNRVVRLRIPTLYPRSICRFGAFAVHFFLGVSEGGRGFAGRGGVKPEWLVGFHTPNRKMQVRKIPAQFHAIRKPPVRLETGFANFLGRNREADSR